MSFERNLEGKFDFLTLTIGKFVTQSILPHAPSALYTIHKFYLTDSTQN